MVTAFILACQLIVPWSRQDQRTGAIAHGDGFFDLRELRSFALDDKVVFRDMCALPSFRISVVYIRIHRAIFWRMFQSFLVKCVCLLWCVLIAYKNANYFVKTSKTSQLSSSLLGDWMTPIHFDATGALRHRSKNSALLQTLGMMAATAIVVGYSALPREEQYSPHPQPRQHTSQPY